MHKERYIKDILLFRLRKMFKFGFSLYFTSIEQIISIFK